MEGNAARIAIAGHINSQVKLAQNYWLPASIAAKT